MRPYLKIWQSSFVALCVVFLSAAIDARADVSQAPLYLTASATPLMMITLSRDEQLFNKAYPDYTDLDDDGKLDTTYQDAFDYSGYFDSKLCYTYTADNRFKAAANATDINGNGKAHECGTAAGVARWSGNFLNWVSMSRIDVLRSVLYGGYRHDGATPDTGDTSSKTVLERAHIPNDLHAWAKVYSGSDIISYTPYATVTTFCNASFSTTDSPKIRIASGSYPEWASTALQQCQWADDAYANYTRTTSSSSCPVNYGNPITSGGNNGKCRVTGYVYGGNTYNVTNTTCTGTIPTSGAGAIPRCIDPIISTTTVSNCQGASGNNSCYDDAPKSAALLGSTTGAIARVEVCDPTSAFKESFCNTYGTNSSKPTGVLQVYAEPLTGSTDGRVRFGLLSGSYSNPRSGGVLRRNIGKMTNNTSGTNFGNGCVGADEISLTTGQFCASPEAATGSLVNSINSFKIANNTATWNGNWSDCGTYSINNRTGGNGHLNNPGSTTGTNYKCSAWGNPIAEMYGETLRYLSGLSKTAAFSSGTDLTGLAAPNWKDPYSTTNNDGGSPYCANCNILVMSSGLSSFDGDEVPDVPSLQSTVDTATKEVGDLEAQDLSGGASTTMSGQYFIGRSLNHLDTTQVGSTLVVGEAANTHEDLCQGREIDDLSKAVGLCPDTPAQEGTFKIAGLAFKARTQDLRGAGGVSVINKPADAKTYANTYAVALAESLPKFDIPVAGKKLTLAPLCQANNTGTATAASTDWRSCFLGSVSIGPKTSIAPTTSSATATTRYTYGRALEDDGSAGTFTFVWEDSQWGNDHDNDVVTMVTYCVGTTCNRTTGTRNGTSTSLTASYSGYDICWRSDSAVCGTSGTPAVAADEVLIRVENVSAYAGNAMLTGFSMSGAGSSPATVTNDGDGLKRIALRPGGSDNSILTQSENPPGAWALPKVLKFKAGATSVKKLENPLWYAAKFGGFKTLDETIVSPTPVNQGLASWGVQAADSTRTPNNFFQIRDPAKLRTSLDAVFKSVLEQTESSAAAIATNSTRLDTNTLIYQAKFNSKDWSGEVVAYGFDSNGKVSATPTWNTTTLARPVRTNSTFTWNDASNKGVQFSWASISAAQEALLNGSSADGEARLNWILGTTSYTYPATFKALPTKWLGDIVNSDPFFVGELNFGYQNLPATAAGRDSYLEFRGDYAGRTKLLYVGANDGMLHALDALTGVEKFAYVPAGIYGDLPKLSDPNYKHQYYVDGGPKAGDAFFASPNVSGAVEAWHTVLVGTTGAGGNSVFALDVTDPVAASGALNFSADNVLWEITNKTRCASDSADLTVPGCFADLGYTIGQATVGRMQDGTWVAIFGNGYSSANKKAVLYIVDISNGQLIKKIETCAATDASCLAGNNGLSTPALLVDGTRTITAAYAGDLKGNLWKFDLSSNMQTSWGVAYGGALFAAVNADGIAQPITAPVDVGANPAGGYMIYFGTGKYYEVGDNTVGSNPSTQSFYGIWDNGAVVSGRSVLQEQTIIAELSQEILDADGDVIDTLQLRGVSDTDFTYSSSKQGWYLDLISPVNGKQGERVVSAAQLRNGRIIFVTLIPTGDACTGGGESWLMEIDALSGGRTDDIVFDLNGNGDFGQGDFLKMPDGSQIPVSGMKPDVGIIGKPAIISLGTKETKVAGGSKSSIMQVFESGGPKKGRQSWRQVH